MLPAFPKDVAQIYYANPISDFVGYSTILQLETAKFNTVTVTTTKTPPALVQKRAIKIGDNFAFKFFLVVSFNVRQKVVRHAQHASHEELVLEQTRREKHGIYNPTPPNAQNNISNNPGNNSIVLRFNSQFVKGETSDQLENRPTTTRQQFNDPIVSYLQNETCGKEILKEQANDIVYTGMFSWFGL